jgi:hypothetical protein
MAVIPVAVSVTIEPVPDVETQYDTSIETIVAVLNTFWVRSHTDVCVTLFETSIAAW